MTLLNAILGRLARFRTPDDDPNRTALLEVRIPERDGWEDELASRVCYFAVGAFLMHLGLRTWSTVDPTGVIGAIPTALMFASGVQLAILAALNVDLNKHGRKIGYAATILLTLLTILMMWQTGDDVFPRLGADVLAFTSYGTEIFVEQGRNPFVESMYPAHELPGAPDRWTWRTDGSRVVEWSYPGGTLWVYSLQYATVGRWPIGLRFTSIIGVGLLALVLVYALPSIYSSAAILSLTVAQNHFLAAAGGLNDMWWVLFVVLTILFWARDRRVLAAALFGVACAMKQQAWPIALYLAIWVYKESGGWRDFGGTAARYIGAGLATFGLLNLPWLVWSPQQWLVSVLVPLGAGGKAPLVSTGVGVAVLNFGEMQHVPRSVFRALVGIAILGTATLYYRWFDELRWAAWMLPMVVFLFTPRSLPSYFHWFLPVALVAIMAAHGRLRGQEVVHA